MSSATATSDRNRTTAARLALFLGHFGIHRFYLGRKLSGWFRLLLACTIGGLFITVPWALLDSIRLFGMSGEDLARKCR